MSLEEARKKIDRLDDEIVRLLDLRAGAGREAAEAKRRLGRPLHDPGREAEVVRRLADRPNGVLPRQALENIYRAIMGETLAVERAGESCPGPAAQNGHKLDIAAKVLENFEAAPGFFRMRLKAPELADAFRPGQFFQLRIAEDGGGPFLRRPFAPSETGGDGLAFLYAVVGEGTRRMAGLSPGATVGLLAPLGNAYTPLPAGASALLIGGGCGAPSLAPLAKWLKACGVKVTALIGARTATLLLEHETFAKVADRVVLATDDGSRGCRGTVTDALRLENPDASGKFNRVYACGPMPMLKAAAALAGEMGVDCEVSLEERMACGFGACVGCAVPVLDAKAEGGFVYRRVCHEGPVFKADALAWEAMARV